MTDLTTNAAGAATRSRREEVNGQSQIWNLVARALGVRTDGATGEEQVSRELARLPHGWHVLHAVPIGNTEIDHVVIGPRGIFTLNTKHHPDVSVCVYENGLWLNGHSTVYLHNSRCEAKRTATILTAACATPVEVRPAIVFVDLAKLTMKGTPPDVHITTRRSLRNFLMQEPTRLTPVQVEHIFTVARNSATWQPS
jgi:hypothetical protein